MHIRHRDLQLCIGCGRGFYQHLPLIILTSDRNHYYLNQQEDQCVPQKNLYSDIVRKSVDLPIVRDGMDFGIAID